MNRGSANIAIDRVGARLVCDSARSIAIVDADGKLTVSWVTTSGSPFAPTRSIENGTRCNAPSDTTNTRSPVSISAAGRKIESLSA